MASGCPRARIQPSAAKAALNNVQTVSILTTSISSLLNNAKPTSPITINGIAKGRTLPTIPFLGTVEIASNSSAGSGVYGVSARSMPLRCPAPTTTSIFSSVFDCMIFSAINRSRSSISASPAPGENSLRSSIMVESKSESESNSSRSKSSSSSSSSPKREKSNRNRSLHFIFLHARRIVTWMSRSTNATSSPAVLAVSTAANSSAPGSWPSLSPKRRCSALNMAWISTIGALPSLMTRLSPSLSSRRPSTSASCLV